MRHLFSRKIRYCIPFFVLASLIVGMLQSGGTGAFAQSSRSALAKATIPSAIQVENSLPGDPTWNDFSTSLTPDLISGYGSKISVNHGDSIDFFVTTTTPSFSIDIYRTGYYNGLGARKITSLGTFPGVHQAIPTPDPITGMVACNWTKTTTLAIPTTWLSGVYLARLNASTGDKSFIFFVVRNDGGHEALLFQTSVTTYQAYNTWGGTSLYNNNTDKSIYSGPHATKVSFDRPFNPGDSNGAGHYFFFELKFVYWMESQGYDVAYTTDVDTDSNASTLSNHKGFLSVGHDEYWSKGMRDTVQQAINTGVNVAFFGANEMYWQIRFEADAAGNPRRVEVGYKDYATATTFPGPDPLWHVNDSIVTGYWREAPVSLPENAVSGVMYENQVNQSYPFVVQNSSNWVYAGTGFTDGSSVPGIVGYEYDKVFNNGVSPAGLTILGNSPVVNVLNANTFSNATLYTAPGGANVFAAGTIEWSWGLANVQGNTAANAGIQRATANILDNFTNSQLVQVQPAASLNTTSLNFGNQNINTAGATQTVTVSNTGGGALSISGIAVAGTNASDYTQTNTCPASLAAAASCTIIVTFTPAATGTRAANLQVTDNASDSPQTITLSGGGVVPVITLSPGNVNFGNQNVGVASAVQKITLTNSGTATLAINNIAVTGTNASDYVQTNTCGATVAVNTSCTITVAFTPAATGARAANVQITDNAAASPQTITFSGVGVVPAATLSPSSVSFGNQDVGVASAVQTVTLTNPGTAALTVSNIAVNGTNASDYTQANTCGATVAVNASCTITVTFTPAAAGVRAANLQITDNAANSPQTVVLNGTGAIPVSVYLGDDFESGTLNAWKNASSLGFGSVKIQNSVVNSGHNALAISNTLAFNTSLYGPLSSGPQTQTFTRLSFRYNSQVFGIVPLAYGRNANGGNVWEVDINTLRHGLDIYFWSASTVYHVFSPNNGLSANAWYTVEVQDMQVKNGHAEVWLNGSSVGSVNGDLSVTNPYADLMLYNNSLGGTIYFDDVRVASAF